jgi:hypothetical protein
MGTIRRQVAKSVAVIIRASRPEGSDLGKAENGAGLFRKKKKHISCCKQRKEGRQKQKQKKEKAKAKTHVNVVVGMVAVLPVLFVAYIR